MLNNQSYSLFMEGVNGNSKHISKCRRLNIYWRTAFFSNYIINYSIIHKLLVVEDIEPPGFVPVEDLRRRWAGQEERVSMRVNVSADSLDSNGLEVSVLHEKGWRKQQLLSAESL